MLPYAIATLLLVLALAHYALGRYTACLPATVSGGVLALLAVLALLCCTGCSGNPTAPSTAPATVCAKATYYVGSGTYANTYTVQWANAVPPTAVVPMYYCTGTVQ